VLRLGVKIRQKGVESMMETEWATTRTVKGRRCRIDHCSLETTQTMKGRRCRIDHCSLEMTQTMKGRRCRIDHCSLEATHCMYHWLPTPSTLTDASSNRPQESGHRAQLFPLLRLLPELRIKVYIICLCLPEPLILGENLPDDDKDRKRRQYEQITPALLRTSRQIHREAWKYLYTHNEFLVRTAWVRSPLAGLRQRERSLIRRIVLDMADEPTYIRYHPPLCEALREMRYCWGLREVRLIVDWSQWKYDLPDPYGREERFCEPLKFLPQKCRVTLSGKGVPEDVKRRIEDALAPRIINDR
jgi:hypothetical protein